MSTAIASADLWPHQQRGLEQLFQAWETCSRVVLAAPTGSGKTRMMGEIASQAEDEGKRVVVYSNRKMLTEQTSGVFESFGLHHGIRASGHKPRLLANLQISSIQTENARVFKQEKWELHEADIVVVDEAHNNKSEVAQKILNAHAEQGAKIVGFTATPVGLAGLYEKLVQAAKNSELRKCGAHVPCYTYGPTDVDTSHIKKNAVGEYSEESLRKAIKVQTIFGRVYDNWRKLNPFARPAILFAPGVAESKWFVDLFRSKGVTAAHIDGEKIYYDGEEYDASPSAREDLLGMSEDGRIKIISNRFVLREGIDAPWLFHGIAATVFGALSSFLQAGGRLLRSHESLDHVIWQCHGGSWWRHGSLNEDREWELGDTDKSIAKKIKEAREKGTGEHTEPIVCPKCHGLRLSGPKCPHCGHEHQKSVRIVLQVNGELKRMTGRAVKAKPKASDEQKAWNGAYFSARNAGGKKTMKQVLWDARRRNGGKPIPEGVRGMPAKGSSDWNLSVASYEVRRNS